MFEKSKITNSEPWWWEKTVEYAFVRHVMGDSVACPMAGKPEKWLGDLVEKIEDKFRLIEFKRITDASSEDKKYGGRNYIDACSDLPNKNQAAHWLVFGAMDGGELTLQYRRYLDGSDKNQLLTNSENMSTMNFADFIVYIDALMRLRGQEEGGASGGLVMVGVEGSKMTVLDLSELSRFRLQLEKRLAPESSSAPAPRM